MKLKKYLCAFCVISLMAILLTVPAFAAGGDVAGAVEQTWDDAATQIKTVVDNVVFPALSMILAIAFFVNDPCHCILCEAGNVVLRLPHKGTIRMDWSCNPLCLPYLRTAGPQLHLGHHRHLRIEGRTPS